MNSAVAKCVVLTDDGTGVGNIGDRLIHAGVCDLLDRVQAFEKVFISRGARDISGLGSPDWLVYAGMPQFGSRCRPTGAELLWGRLLTLARDTTTIANIGGGTGYSLLHNRLSVAADMVRREFNRAFYGGQRHVIFLPRDPLSWHFLDILGQHATLLPCPSLFAPRHPTRPRRRLGIAVINPDRIFNADEKRIFGNAVAEVLKCLIRANPSALLICQQRSDLAWLRKTESESVLLPKNVEEFDGAVGSVETLVSFRVHATVNAVRHSVRTLCVAVDGRSDLLTPYIAMGAIKVNPTWHSVKSLSALIDDFIGQTGRPCCDETFIQEQRATAIETLGGAACGASSIGSVIKNPLQISSLRCGDQIILTADEFSTNVGTRLHERIQVSLAGFNQHIVYGPYRSLPVGRYEVIFDFDFWGGGSDFSSSGSLILDVDSGRSTPLSRREVKLATILKKVRIPTLEFEVEDEDSSLEFRIGLVGSAPALVLDFHGVRLRRLERYPPP